MIDRDSSEWPSGGDMQKVRARDKGVAAMDMWIRDVSGILMGLRQIEVARFRKVATEQQRQVLSGCSRQLSWWESKGFSLLRRILASC